MTKNNPGDIGTAHKIIESARKEFARYGLAGARVDRIALSAGINKAMIYYHFRSKENLYQEVINEHLARIGDFLEENLSQGQELETLLVGMTRFYDQMFANRGDFAPIFLRELAAGGDRIRDAFSKMMSERAINVKLKQLMETGKRRGEFGDLDRYSCHNLFHWHESVLSDDRTSHEFSLGDQR